jgi:septal ring factor EnvC (AmiA/AmiB activator)
MTEKAKVPIVVLIALILISLAIAVSGFYLFQKEKAKNLQLQDKLEEITVSLRRTETSLDEYKKKSSDLESQLKLAQGNIEKLKSELQQERTAREQTEAKMELLKQDLEQQKGLRSDLEKRFSQTQDDAKKTQAQIRELEAKKQELEVKISDLEKQSQGVELGKIVVSPETSKPLEVAEKPAEPVVKKEKTTATLGREGKVLVVNKDYNFAVINLGSKDGIGPDDLFSVYHNNKYVGDVKVEKVHESMAAAGFVSSDIKDKVFEGDKVAQKVR